MSKSDRIKSCATLLALVPLGASLPAQTAPTKEKLPELEAFILRESDLAQAGDVMPTSRAVNSVFGSQSITEVPRSVTVLTPELMKQFDIKDFADLSKIGAGTQQINYYGVPGIPTLRGAKGSVFYNGMARAFNRNEMPLSFGSLEGMDLVKGPAPAHLGAALVGGYVNLIPKQPYFDQKRGSVQLEVGQYKSFRVTTDVGGPTLIKGKPAAYRFSATGQLADSYYDKVGNDFVSLYGSLKVEVAKDVTFFTGGEYYNYKSNENAGWNRPTQELIDSGRYVIGEPISVADSRWAGTANRNLIYGGAGTKYGPAVSYTATALVVDQATVDAGVAAGFITAAQRALMNNLATDAGRSVAYSTIPTADLPFISQTSSGYQYTPEYFAAGGKVFTKEIDGSTVLADDADFANSEDVFWFGDLESRKNPDRAIRFQTQIEYISTQKTSSYGYAINTKQFAAEGKLSVTETVEPIKTKLTYGTSLKYNYASQLQDFWDEPFSRRDITSTYISGNSKVHAGGGSPTGSGNYWNGGFGGQSSNALSEVGTGSAFVYGETKFTDKLSLYSSGLLAYAAYSLDVPDAAKPGTSAAGLAAVKDDHDYAYYSASLSPQYKITKDLIAYVTVQRGTAMDPLQGGPIKGRSSFAKNEIVEGGLKSTLVNGKLYAGVAGYNWRQESFNARQSVSEELEGKGYEFEATYTPTPALTFVGSANFQKVTLEGSGTPFRAVPMSEQDWALYGGILNDPFDVINTAGPFGNPVNNPDREYPGTPETQFKLLGTYKFQSGFGVTLGGVWSDSYWHNFDHTIKLPSTLVLNGALSYAQPSWDASVGVENITDEDYYAGSDPIFGAGTIITKAPGVNWKATLTFRF